MTDWDPNFYKTGYEGFERPEKFATPQALENYRQLLLSKTELQTEFIVHHFGRQPLRVIEIGSGNGRLLASLGLKGVLASGFGIEIARSRVAFAQQWLKDLSLAQAQCVVADTLEFDAYQAEGYDLAACITGAFGYFRPIAENAPGKLLSKIHAALAPGGSLLLELYQLPEKRQQMLMLNDGKLRLWQPLPPEDPFAYYLDDFDYWPERRILRHGKIFIGRDGTVDAGREEVLAYYTANELTGLLRQFGFGMIQLFADFQGSEYCEGRSASLIVLARVEKK